MQLAVGRRGMKRSKEQLVRARQDTLRRLARHEPLLSVGCARGAHRRFAQAPPRGGAGAPGRGRGLEAKGASTARSIPPPGAQGRRPSKREALLSELTGRFAGYGPAGPTLGRRRSSGRSRGLEAGRCLDRTPNSTSWRASPQARLCGPLQRESRFSARTTLHVPSWLAACE